MQTDLLTPSEFDTHVANGTFRLAFIGMSNAGKTYRSRKLYNDLDFLWFHVDREIQKELGFENMEDISEWIGFPSSDTYTEREAKYLELENKHTKLSSMRTDGKNFVFDTTGSVAHLDQDTLDILHENCLIVHLDVGEDSLEEMMERFFSHPKPVAWVGYFNPQQSESEEETLRRSYPKLLTDRLRIYRNLAHLNIPAQKMRDKSAEETLQIIRSYLVKAKP